MARYSQFKKIMHGLMIHSSKVKKKNNKNAAKLTKTRDVSHVFSCSVKIIARQYYKNFSTLDLYNVRTVQKQLVTVKCRLPLQKVIIACIVNGVFIGT